MARIIGTSLVVMMFMLFGCVNCEKNAPDSPVGDVEEDSGPQPKEEAEVPITPLPSDYIDKDRAVFLRDGKSTGSLTQKLQYNTWAGWRDVAKVVNNCPEAWGDLFPMSREEAKDFAIIGQGLAIEGRRFEARLDLTNRRCRTQPEFCNKTGVAKKVFKPYIERLDTHIAKANMLRDLAQAVKNSDCAGSFDSIAGWCTKCG